MTGAEKNDNWNTQTFNIDRQEIMLNLIILIKPEYSFFLIDRGDRC